MATWTVVTKITGGHCDVQMDSLPLGGTQPHYFLTGTDWVTINHPPQIVVNSYPSAGSASF